MLKYNITKSTTLTFVQVLLAMYVDDMAIPFANRQQLCKGMPLVQQLLSDLGLEMHIGKRIGENTYKVSKTECVFFSPPCYFKDLLKSRKAIGQHVSASDTTLINADFDKLSEEEKEKRVIIEDDLYDSCQESDDVMMNGGIITYSKHFKYLGTFISYNLRDDYDIDKRIAAASKAMGALKLFFNKKEVSTYSKYLIFMFMAIPINLLLWGCENWSLRVDHVNKLEQFVTPQIRKLLHINMLQIKDERITLDELRSRFSNITSVQTMIDICKIQFLGKIVRDHVSSPPRQLLISYVSNKRRVGRPQKCSREAMFDSLKKRVL